MGRLHIPGGCYHVIGRGLERRYIFNAHDDKRDFLNRLEQNLSRTGAQCLAWALMSNHYHLLIRAGEAPLDKLMAPLLGGFAGSYNRRKQRSGYVFQDRFQSILCEEDAYFLELVRYIHLNPLRAGLIESLSELDKYPWTGHSAFMGNTHCEWLAVKDVLSHFGERTSLARSKYRSFIEDGIGETEYQNLSGGGLVRSYKNWEVIAKLRKEHVSCIGDERILGSGEFVESVLSQDDLEIETGSLRQRQGWNFEVLLKSICLHFDLSQTVIKNKARAANTSNAKALLCYWAIDELGMTVSAVAQKLNISQQAVSRRVRQGALLCMNQAANFEELELSC